MDIRLFFCSGIIPRMVEMTQDGFIRSKTLLPISLVLAHEGCREDLDRLDSPGNIVPSMQSPAWKGLKTIIRNPAAKFASESSKAKPAAPGTAMKDVV